MSEIEIIAGDLTELSVDAIVCPAHKHLTRGQGLSAQIFAKAGEQLVQECHLIEDCKIGEARITHAHHLPANHIIHTVTPQWSSGDQWGAAAVQQLRQCYHEVLKLASQNHILTLAFPALGAGSNRFPHSIAASVGLDVLMQYRETFNRLIVCLYSNSDQRAWEDTLEQIQLRMAKQASKP